jgi:5'-nucleotidase
LKILLTNDDGVHAPGLWAAARALRQVGEVFVVAPDREQSGVGSSLTLRSPLRIRGLLVDPYLSDDGGDRYSQLSLSLPLEKEYVEESRDSGGTSLGEGVFAQPLIGQKGLGRITAYAVEGTPADSCILALERVVGPVDLVVSGINAGSNLGWDVMVSGTVGAAIQGYVRGYTTIAISVGSVQNPRFTEAALLLGLLGQRLAHRPPTTNLFLNINVPSLPLAQIKGLQVTRLGGRSYGESVREEGNGPQKRYWIDRNLPMAGDAAQGVDLWAMKNDQISITPLQLSLSNQQQIPAIEDLLADLPNQLLHKRD